MNHLIFFIFVILVSALLSLVEIQVEGRNGYADKLPVSWRTNNKWIRLFLTGTSYHLWMGLFLLAFVHLPFIVGLSWTIQGEMQVLSFLAFVTVLEDFLWFVLNPSFRIRKFKKQYIPWFQGQWLWCMPAWYAWYLPAAILLYWGSFYLR